MRFWGRRRQTEDVDLLANNSPKNAERLYEAIRIILGYTPAFTAHSLAQPSKQVRLGAWGPDLDILTSMKGLKFEVAYARREIIQEGGVPVSVISKKHLLFIKRAEARTASNRLKKATDDIEFLESS